MIRHRLGRRALLRGTGIATAGLATAALIGCAAADDETPADRHRITFADAFEAGTYFDGSGGLFAIREGITSGLVAIDFDSQFRGSLAESWETPDELTWVFPIRSGVRFHSGEEMTAEHVAANLQRLSESDAGIAAFQGTAVEVDGSRVILRTDEPLPYMPAILANGLAAIYHPSSYEGDPASTLPIGVGPFRLTAFRPGDRRVLEAFDDYWGGRPGVAGVDYLMVPEAQTRAAQIRTGDADITRVLNPEDVPTLEGAEGVQVLTTALPRVRVLYTNLRRGITQDERVRRALAAAVERQPIVDSVLEGLSAPMTTLFRTDYPWGDPTIGGVPEDIAEATKLLAAAGYTEASPAPVTLATYPSRAELPLIAQVLQQQLQRAPFRVTLDIGDYTPFETRALAGELDVTLVARNPLFLFDPQGAFESDYTSTGSYNLSGFGALDAEIAATATLLDAEERYSRYRTFERRIIEEDVATIGLNAYTQIDAVRTSVTGYAPHPTDAIALHERIVKA